MIKSFINFVLICLIFVLYLKDDCYAQLHTEKNNKLVIKEIDIYEALQQVALKYEYKIIIKGQPLDANINLTISDVNFSQALYKILNSTTINNYSYYLDHVNKIAHVSILDRSNQDKKITKQAKRDENSKSNTANIVQMDQYMIFERDGNTQLGETDQQKKFNYEEIEALIKTYQTNNMIEKDKNSSFTSDQINELKKAYGKNINEDTFLQATESGIDFSDAQSTTTYEPTNEPLSKDQLQKLKILYGDKITPDDIYSQ